MITIVCCYNNEECLQNMLLPSLKKQKCEFELILINNNIEKYKSAAEAYNKEGVKAKGDIIIFCHQDIVFDEGALKKIQNIFEKKSDIILGAAGIKKDGLVYSQLKYFATKELITQKQLDYELERVESIDECMFAITKENFKQLMFDEYVCDNWHLYGVELCYHGKLELNLKSMVTDIQIYHKMQAGTGLEVDENYLKTMDKLCKKYKKREKFIYAPCYIVSTQCPQKNIKFMRTRSKLLFKRIREKRKI